MTMSLEAAAQAMREAMRETVKRHSLWYLIQGALMVLGGILALVYPIVSSVAVVLFLGWVLIISGVVQGISLIGAQHVPHFWLQLISVVLSVIVGVLFIRQPGEGLLAITLLLIVFLMVEGISKIVFALTIRPFPNWGWVLASGVIGILLSLFLWASLPVTAIWLLGVLLGIHLICEGAALGYLAWQVRPLEQPASATARRRAFKLLWGPARAGQCEGSGRRCYLSTLHNSREIVFAVAVISGLDSTRWTNRVGFATAQRWTSTGILQWVRTFTVSLPRTIAEMPWRPCEAMTIRSQPFESAVS